MTEGPVGTLKLRYVKSQRDRHGRVQYWYFRRSGRQWRLPGAPGSVEFAVAYESRLAETSPSTPPANGVQAYPPKSFGALALDYYASPEYRDRKPSTQGMYRRVIDERVSKAGHLPVALIERKHVKKWRDEKAETPGMANMVVSVMRLLMTYAMDNDYRKDNPVVRLKQLELGEHRAWTPEELAAFEQRWPPGAMQRRAYILARYTGQRCGDVAGMTRAHRRDGMIRVRQQKTDTELEVQEHRELAAELARGEQGHMALLTKANSRAWSPDELSGDFGDWIEAAGLPDDCVMHGLRKVAARDLADAGCSAHEIMSVTGHKSLKEVERYTKAANQRHLAKAAILKLERNGNRTATGKRPPGNSGKRHSDD